MVVPAGNYMLKVNNKNTRARCEMFSKLTIKTCSGVSIVNFEQVNAGWDPCVEMNIRQRFDKSNKTNCFFKSCDIPLEF